MARAQSFAVLGRKRCIGQSAQCLGRSFPLSHNGRDRTALPVTALQALESNPCPKAPIPTPGILPFSPMKEGTFNFYSVALKMPRSLILYS